jgi:hypothetical protein
MLHPVFKKAELYKFFLVIFDNYESEQVYFPLSWKEADKEFSKI